jgi:predicted signal transduction protein with EAL and GGDEF domain
VGIGIGIALIPQDGTDETELMRKADIALYRAKTEKGSVARFFEPEMDARIRERDIIERELRIAMVNGGVQPHFQPLVEMCSQRIIGFEALARWNHPTLGNVPPDRFIPVAEDCGLISALTDHLLRQASKAASQWPQQMTLSFNVSAVQLKDATAAERILAIIKESGLSPLRLEVELTESAIVQDLEGAKKLLGALRKAGVRIALDDFGTGYSSLYHLRNFKVDKIKIDRSFVENVDRDADADALIRGLLGLGHGLGLTVTAEGVESSAQALALLGHGCDQAQGYLYGRALTAADALALAHKSEDAPSQMARIAI